MATGQEIINFGSDAEVKAFQVLRDCKGKTEQQQVLLSIKNFLIGSASSKNHFVQLGLLPVLKDVLSNPPTDEILVQAADCVGSLSLPTPAPDSENFSIEPKLFVAQDPMDISTTTIPIPPEEQNVYQLFNQDFHSVLIKLIPHKNYSVVKSILRALKNLFSSCCTPGNVEEENVLKVASLLNHPEEMVVYYAGQFLARLCSSRFLPASTTLPFVPQESLINSPTSTRIPKQILESQSALRPLRKIQDILLPDALQTLLHLLKERPISKLSQCASLDAISQITFDNQDAAEIVLGSDATSSISVFIGFIQQSSNVLVQFHACHCVTNLIRTQTFSENLFKPICLLVIPTLIRIINIEREDNDGIMMKEVAPLILARLIEKQTKLQQTVVETGLLSNVTSFLSGLDDIRFHRVCGNRLLLLASCCSLYVGGRQILARSLPTVRPFLTHSSAIIRASSCRVIQSLSRSLKQLRTSLVDSHVAEPLFKLLSDENLDVQINASAAICNLVLAFSASKEDIIKSGGCKALVPLLQSPSIELKCNCLWALRNMVYATEGTVKKDILIEMGSKSWESLFADENIEIQVQTMVLIRNVVCKDSSLLLEDPTSIGYHIDIRKILLEKLAMGVTEMTRQCLFVVCNICSEFNYKAFGMDTEILDYIRKGLEHKEESVRHVAVLCLINLTWVSLDSETVNRKNILTELGFEEILRLLKTKESGRLLEQINTCLSQFSAAFPFHANINMDMVD